MFIWFIEGKPRVYNAEPIPRPGVGAVRAISASEKVESSAESIAGLSGLPSPYDRLGEDPPARERAITISQIMSSPVISIAPQATVGEASELFKERRIHHGVVLGDQKELVGILSDRDVLRCLATTPADVATTLLVQDVMVKRVLSASPDCRIRETARIMFEQRIGAMPVVDEQGQVLGIVTRSDILRTVMNRAPLELWT